MSRSLTDDSCSSFLYIVFAVSDFFFPFLVVSWQLWDLNMDSGPVATFQVHEYLRPKVKVSRFGDFDLIYKVSIENVMDIFWSEV